MKNNHLKYKSAWLIGSSGEIGESFSKILSEYADKISLCDMKNSSEIINKGNNFWKIDCADDKQFKKFADESVVMFGSPDLMLLTAGYVFSSDLTNTSSNELDKIYSNNFKLVSIALKLFFEKCSKDVNIPKNIIVVSSNAGLEPRPNQPVYAAMKSAINSLVKSQAAMWGKYNIKINAIAPGTVVVNRNIVSLKKKYPDFPIDLSRPLGRISFPEDLHSICRFLLDQKLLMTGQILVIDGGSSLT
ncbi:MAG: SDR family NAD(P)-dependent oxidoreductase [Candidatus Nomurabacteria bacterium]|nr:SDR family NAD(P)-dependent oxidoreductase [Candidatus Nomurabacteria bacterium]